MSTMLRFLHLSDLHFTRGEIGGTDWAVKRLNQDAVNNSLLESIKQQTENKPLDFAIISGDIAFSGKREEYEVALLFFKQLADITELPLPSIYIVAGNHDVDRAKLAKSHRRLYTFESQDDITEVLADPDFGPIILRKFSEFNGFAEQMMERAHYSDTTYHFSQVLNLDKNQRDLRINLLGLNSALFSGFGEEEHKLALSQHQVDKALGQMDADAPLSLAFFHHPFAVLHPAEKTCINRLKHKLDMVLQGHLHQASGAYEQSGAGEAILLSAGAAYETRASRNGYNLVNIDLCTGKGQVEFFKYLPEHHCWNRNNDVCPHQADGKFHFHIPKLENFVPEFENTSSRQTPASLEINASSPSQPAEASQLSDKMHTHFIHDYLLPDNFTGRKQQREQLQAFLSNNTAQAAGLAAICALGGMGKSCLARQVLQDLTQNPQQPYQQAVWFSFYEARTEDEAYALREMLTSLGQNIESNPEQTGASQATQLRKQLCRYLDQQAIFLILDGLEVIQHTDDPHSPHYGQIRSSYKESALLIRHCANQQQSRILITTRVPLTELDGVAGYQALDLPVFSNTEAADYLQKIGVMGTQDELRQCAELIGGHPLCLKAAGKQMQRRRIPAKQIEQLIGDAALFRRNSEGERVAKIVDTYRKDLTPEQIYFLQMLSIHPRSVSERHFPALVHDYGNKGRDKTWVQEYIIDPLDNLGLIEVLAAPDNGWQYSAHPLMKLAFAAWLNPQDKNQAHEQWAKAAQTSPALVGSPDNANSLEALQPWLDVIEHYLDAKDWDSAWQIYRGKAVDRRLMDLAYAHRLLALGQRFEQALSDGWSLNDQQQIYVFEYLGHACSDLNRMQELTEYLEKSFTAAQATGNSEIIVGYGAVLAESYVHLGTLNKASVMMQQIKTQAEALSTGEAKSVYQSIQARLVLFSGDYQRAISLFDEAIKPSLDSYNRTLYSYCLGEAELRAKLYSDAQQTLQQALQQAEQQHIKTLIPAILDRLTWLALAQNQTDLARTYNDKCVALQKSLDLPGQEDDGFLLVSEGNYQQAAKQAQAKLDEIRVDGLHKANEIKNLIILSQAQHGLGDTQTAQAALNQAEQIMQETGCWKDKNWLQETQVLLA